LKETDEAWLVVDMDQWSIEQIGQLFAWSQLKENYGLALSNPMFEFWLLLHFEDGNKVTSANECSERLKRHLPEYKKGIDIRKFTVEAIHNAIRRAKQRDNPPCTDWPKTMGVTTVYRLVEKLVSADPKEKSLYNLNKG
ncbi:MAG TPA: RloB family protein, partial [Gammaproteobacteria bacterium]|nr:RloB family protein [Gammaproteobacteria bacterium]